MTRASRVGVALAFAAAASAALGAEQRYVLGAGESLETVAERAYGNAELAAWLAATNRLSAAPEPGDELILPGADRHVVTTTDTWAVLAERSLGSGDLADDLARLNGRAPDVPLATGEPVRLPALASYRIVPGDSLARVSRRFYATPELAPLLARLNGMTNAGHVVAGRTIRVPIPHVVELSAAVAMGGLPEPAPAEAEEAEIDPTTPPELAGAEVAPVAEPLEAPMAPPPPESVVPARAAKPAPAPAPRAEPRKEKATASESAKVAPVSAPPPARAAPEFGDALRAATNAYLDGRYDAALESLERMRPDVLAQGTASEQSALLRQLAFVYVAYDRGADACSAWRALRRSNGDTALDPIEISPKIREAISSCR